MCWTSLRVCLLLSVVPLLACSITAAPASLQSTAAPPASVERTPSRAGTGPPLITFAPPAVADCTHFAAPDGDDSASGSEAAAWGTLQGAAEAAAPGDVICFRGGTYPVADTITLSVSGSEEAPITFAAYPGESPVLDGGGSVGGLIDFAPGVSYVRLTGFALTGFRIWGINVPGGNHDLWLDHLDVGGGEAGVHFTLGSSGDEPEEGPVSRIVLEDSFVHDVLYSVVDCTPGPCDDMIFRRLEISGAGLTQEESFAADGLALERGQNVLVEDCIIHDNGGDGIDLNSRDFAGSVAGVMVRRNLVFRNHLQGIKLWAGGRMENNAIWGQGINPVMLGAHPGHYEVVNNTLAYNMWDSSFSARDYSFVAAYPDEEGPASITLVLLNNIFAFNTGPEVGGPTGIYLGPNVTLVREGGNLFFSRDDCEIEAEFVTGRDVCFPRSDIDGGAWAAVSGGTGSFSGDPLFLAGWPDVDLHLAQGSPAIDRGIADGAPPDDLEGRPRGGPPDAGAYEH